MGWVPPPSSPNLILRCPTQEQEKQVNPSFFFSLSLSLRTHPMYQSFLETQQPNQGANRIYEGPRHGVEPV